MRLVLASASPRRAELLRAAGFTFETTIVDVDERVRRGEAPADYVRRLAQEKSAAALSAVVSGFSPTDDDPPQGGHYVRGGVGPPEGGPHIGNDGVRRIVVLGADTAVVVDDEILGKPRDDDEARQMLRRLSGRDHEVLTGISVRTETSELGSVEATTVWFSPLSHEDVEWYVASGEGRDKAGGYAIQGLAARFIPRIAGSYANVVGLPVARVAELLTDIRQLPGKRA